MSGTWPLVLERGVAGLAHEGEGRSGRPRGVRTSIRGRARRRDRRPRPRRRRRRRRRGGRAGAARPGRVPAAAAARGACTQELRHTRGAVMTLAWFDLAERAMRWTGVGNVEARFMRAGDDPTPASTRRSSSAGWSATTSRRCAWGRSRSSRATRSCSRPTASPPTTRPRSSRGSRPSSSPSGSWSGTARALTTRSPSSSGTSGRRRVLTNVNCGWVGSRGSRPRRGRVALFARTQVQKAPGTPARPTTQPPHPAAVGRRPETARELGDQARVSHHRGEQHREVGRGRTGRCAARWRGRRGAAGAARARGTRRRGRAAKTRVDGAEEAEHDRQQRQDASSRSV